MDYLIYSEYCDTKRSKRSNMVDDINYNLHIYAYSHRHADLCPKNKKLLSTFVM